MSRCFRLLCDMSWFCGIFRDWLYRLVVLMLGLVIWIMRLVFYYEILWSLEDKDVFWLEYILVEWVKRYRMVYWVLWWCLEWLD